MVIGSVVAVVLLSTFEITYIRTEWMFSALKICRISPLHSSKPSAEAKRGAADFSLTLSCFSGYRMLTSKSSWNIQSQLNEFGNEPTQGDQPGITADISA